MLTPTPTEGIGDVTHVIGGDNRVNLQSDLFAHDPPEDTTGTLPVTLGVSLYVSHLREGTPGTISEMPTALLDEMRAQWSP